MLLYSWFLVLPNHVSLGCTTKHLCAPLVCSPTHRWKFSNIPINRWFAFYCFLFLTSFGESTFFSPPSWTTALHRSPPAELVLPLFSTHSFSSHFPIFALTPVIIFLTQLNSAVSLARERSRVRREDRKPDLTGILGL